MFELSLGPVPWVYMSETMTEAGLSIGVALNWIFTIIIGLVTPILLEKVGGYFFIGNGAFTVICALFCFFIMKETQGLSEREVAVLYCKQDKNDEISTEKNYEALEETHPK